MAAPPSPGSKRFRTVCPRRTAEEKNAAQTLVTMAVLAVTMFMGITILAHFFQVIPQSDETVISMLARAVFGGRGVAYYLVQTATMLILVLAANTAYADFPRLASILARDLFRPATVYEPGDRLAFSNGIVRAEHRCGILLVVFSGDTHALIPLCTDWRVRIFTVPRGEWLSHGGDWAGRAGGSRGAKRRRAHLLTALCSWSWRSPSSPKEPG